MPRWYNFRWCHVLLTWYCDIKLLQCPVYINFWQEVYTLYCCYKIMMSRWCNVLLLWNCNVNVIQWPVVIKLWWQGDTMSCCYEILMSMWYNVLLLKNRDIEMIQSLFVMKLWSQLIQCPVVLNLWCQVDTMSCCYKIEMSS